MASFAQQPPPPPPSPPSSESESESESESSRGWWWWSWGGPLTAPNTITATSDHSRSTSSGETVSGKLPSTTSTTRAGPLHANDYGDDDDDDDSTYDPSPSSSSRDVAINVDPSDPSDGDDGDSADDSVSQLTARAFVSTRLHGSLAAVLISTVFGLGFARVAILPVVALAAAIVYTRLALLRLDDDNNKSNSTTGNDPLAFTTPLLTQAAARRLAALHAALSAGIGLSLYEAPAESQPPLSAGADYVVALALLGALYALVVVAVLVLASSTTTAATTTAFHDRGAAVAALALPTLWAAAWRVFGSDASPTGGWGNWGAVVALGRGAVDGWGAAGALAGPAAADVVLALLAQAAADAVLFLGTPAGGRQRRGRRDALAAVRAGLRAQGLTPAARWFTLRAAAAAVVAVTAYGVWSQTTAATAGPTVSVACVAPTDAAASADPGARVAALLKGSATAAARGGKVVLWSEAAVELPTAAAVAALYDGARQLSARQKVVLGITYAAPAHSERPGLLHNVVALVAPTAAGTNATVVWEYRKTHLVFIAESHRFAPGNGTVPAAVVHVPVAVDSDEAADAAAASASETSINSNNNKKRPHTPPSAAVAVAGVICHDLDYVHFMRTRAGGALAAAAAAAVAGESGPASSGRLLLAPAKTWSQRAGASHVATTRQRAAELGAAVLRCDAGGGVSAAVEARAGRVRYEYNDHGHAGAVSTAAAAPAALAHVQFVVDLAVGGVGRTRTAYGWLGDWGVVAVAVAGAAVGWRLWPRGRVRRERLRGAAADEDGPEVQEEARAMGSWWRAAATDAVGWAHGLAANVAAGIGTGEEGVRERQPLLRGAGSSGGAAAGATESSRGEKAGGPRRVGNVVGKRVVEVAGRRSDIESDNHGSRT
ncbi:hypothetical protein DFJ73DRAFT_890785 [Zopfochytrium polystomum]|nr:hypothetical protein DFJ73DRAFT_890785 [Zopfochytrium polystomum]